MTDKTMNNKFDFSSVGKRTPYRVPKDFFPTMQQSVLNRIESDTASQPQSSTLTIQARPLWKRRSTLLAAAAVVMSLLVMTFHFTVRTEQPVSQADVETAFDNLSTEDQSYLLAIYAEDVFMEGQQGL